MKFTVKNTFIQGESNVIFVCRINEAHWIEFFVGEDNIYVKLDGKGQWVSIFDEAFIKYLDILRKEDLQET